MSLPAGTHLSRRQLLLLGCGLAASAACSKRVGALEGDAVAVTGSALRSPFPTPVAHPAAPRKKPKRFTCQTPPPAVRVLKGISKYDPKDKTRSQIDPEREAIHKAANKPVSDFASEISDAGDAVASGQAPTGQAECAWTWLSAWAREDALTGPDIDEASRKWTLAVLSSAVLKLQTYGDAPADTAPAVRAWLRHVAQDVRDDYSRDLNRSTRHNNHVYWASWAATVTGIAVDDRSLFDWGLEHYRAAMVDVQPDGSLLLETKRGGRALGYHGLALGALVMLAEAGEANGIPLYQAQDGALRRLAGFTLGAFADPAILTTLSGVEQDLTDAIKPTNLAWIEPYYRRTRDPLAEPWLRSMRPLKRSGLGGDLTMLYGAELT